jgi:tripartite-type tricarboxylate transporter receptor subunit TctC
MNLLHRLRGARAPDALAAVLLAAVSACAALAPAHAAEPYPAKPIRLIVPYPPGGPTDVTARLVAAQMSGTIGQQIIVDNKPGASGMIGAEAVARAEPDGYTILANASLHVINPMIYAQMHYDSFNDFVPITQLADVPLVLVVPATSPIKTVRELVEFGKQHPGSLNFGSAGNASAQQLAGESLKAVAGIQMQHVPYKGSSPALTDLIGGQIQLMFDSMPSAMPFVKAGKLRAIAVSTKNRVAELPDVPTVAESGYPGFDISTWYGFWAPRGTPPAIVAKLAEHAARALKQPQVASQYAVLGAVPVGSSPQAFARYVDTEHTKWAAIVKAAGLTPQ